MCGVTGRLKVVGYTPSSGDSSELHNAVAALAHRGPDDSGEWSDEAAGISMGHRRLSVIDLSSHGHQPMTSNNGRFVLSYNGEVYNASSIRRSLSHAGVLFRGGSDTEVVLEAITAWGLFETLQQLNGMFGFAIWDKKERCLHLARDRFGQKPMYYAWAGKSIVFGSELAAIKKFKDFPANINRDSISLFMRHSNIPAPHTIYQDCWKLLPSSVLTVSSETLETRSFPAPHFYWSASKCAQQSLSNPTKLSNIELAQELNAILKEAVSDCMISDAPLGAFLSGGVDSSIVVALMQEQSRRPVRTFSIGFANASYNEAVNAASVAEHLGTDHTELYVTPQEAQAVIPKLPMIFSEPFADSSQIPTYIVSQLARQKVAVALSGDGGDELFGGYNRYVWSQNLRKLIEASPLLLRRSFSKGVFSLPTQSWDVFYEKLAAVIPKTLHQSRFGEKLHKLASVLDATSKEDMYWKLTSQWQNPTEALLTSNEPSTLLSERTRWPPISDFRQQMMLVDTLTYLPDDILVKLDRASMAVGLETRVPLLDQRVFEFAWHLPPKTKIYKGAGKRILKQILGKYVPKHLFERPKMGFGVPIGDWLRKDLVSWAGDLLSVNELARNDFFQVEPIHKLWLDHLQGKRNHQHTLWPVLMFQAWLDAQ